MCTPRCCFTVTALVHTLQLPGDEPWCFPHIRICRCDALCPLRPGAVALIGGPGNHQTVYKGLPTKNWGVGPVHTKQQQRRLGTAILLRCMAWALPVTTPASQHKPPPTTLHAHPSNLHRTQTRTGVGATATPHVSQYSNAHGIVLPCHATIQQRHNQKFQTTTLRAELAGAAAAGFALSQEHPHVHANAKSQARIPALLPHTSFR